MNKLGLEEQDEVQHIYKEQKLKQAHMEEARGKLEEILVGVSPKKSDFEHAVTFWIISTAGLFFGCMIFPHSCNSPSLDSFFLEMI